MTKKILMAGFACWSVMAVAQASGSKDQAASTAKDASSKVVASGQASGKGTDPKDVATGQTSGKRQHDPVRLKSVSDEVTPAAGLQASGDPKGKSGQDDWQASAAAKSSVPIPSSNQSRVATGDVNGDGKADVAVTNSSSDNKKAKDAASGQASGKTASDVVVTKSTDAASTK